MIKRIIPKLEVKNTNLVKGVNLEGLRVIGDPIDFSQYYYLNGADEIYYQDTVASLYGRNMIEDIISSLSKSIFIPLCVGGGIRSISDIEKCMMNGADKVSINSAAIKNPKFIYNASKIFGSSNIVVNIEAVKKGKDYIAAYENGRSLSRYKVNDWIKIAQGNGAGEIFLTSVNSEGMGLGFDYNLLNYLNFFDIKVPLIIHGGFGNVIHFKEIKNFLDNIDGFGLSSSLHYYYLSQSLVGQKKFEEGNLDFLKSKKIPKNIRTYNIDELKKYLNDMGTEVRL